MKRAAPALACAAFLLGTFGSGLGSPPFPQGGAKTPPPTKPSVAVILHRAVQAQNAKKLERPIRDFTVELKVKIDDPSGAGEFGSSGARVSITPGVSA